MLNKSIYKNPAPGTRTFLVAILILRILSYFMLSEDVAITQTLKAGLRLGLTIAVISAFLSLQLKKDKTELKLAYPLPMWLYAGYILLGIASLLWSTSFAYSLLQIFMDAETLVFVYFFMRVLMGYQYLYPGGFFDIHKIISPAVILVALGFGIGKIVDPDQFYRLTHGGEVSRLGGYIINPNELGMLLVVGIASTLPLLMKDERYRISILAILVGLVYLLFLTGSRSSFIGMLLVGGLYAIQQRSKYFKILLGILLIIAIPVIGIELFIKQSNAEEVMSLTGRLPFWKDLLTYNFPREPWFGYGYMRIDYSDKFESLNAYAGAMTHNTFLQVLLGLGLFGFLLVVVQLSSFLHSMISNSNKSLKNMGALIFIPLLINSFTEFGIFGETNYGILFYLMLVFELSRKPESASLRTNGLSNADATLPDLSFRSAVTA